MGKKTQKEKYFYAFSEADKYNDIIDAVVPNYRLIIDTAVSFVKGIYNVNAKIKIQDVGSGTGNDILPLINAFPHSSLTCWDLSNEMMMEFYKNAKSFGINQKRFEYNVKNYLDTIANPDNYDITVSGYCIHHYPMEIKKVFFDKIYSETKLSGYFILIDLADFNSKEMSNYAHISDLNYIKDSFESRATDSLKKMKQETVDKQKIEWLNHMENENILNTTESQMKALKDSGFDEVECIFKYLQHCVIIAKK